MTQTERDFTGIDELDTLADDLGIAGNARSWIEDNKESPQDIISALATDYDTMRRALQLLIVGGIVSKEKIIQAFHIARTME